MSRFVFLILAVFQFASFLEAGEFDAVKGLDCLEISDICRETAKNGDKAPNSEEEDCSSADCRCHHGHGHTANLVISNDSSPSDSSFTQQHFPRVQVTSPTDYLDRINRPPIS